MLIPLKVVLKIKIRPTTITNIVIYFGVKHLVVLYTLRYVYCIEWLNTTNSDWSTATISKGIVMTFSSWLGTICPCSA